VLDVACGTGVLARTAAERVGPDGSVTGLDINPAMLAVAARHAPEIEWRQGAAEALPFDDESYDAVVSQFGLMFFADRRAALQEMLRVLIPGGRLAVAVFDSLENVPAYATMVAVLERVVGKPAADALRFPFSLGDAEGLKSLFAAAGIAGAVTTTQKAPVRFASVRDMVLADVKGWFPFAGIEVDAPTIEAEVREAEAALAPFLAADGAVAFQVAAHVVTATKAE
jgi:SAM-dependent methyltransferase